MQNDPILLSLKTNPPSCLCQKSAPAFLSSVPDTLNNLTTQRNQNKLTGQKAVKAFHFHKEICGKDPGFARRNLSIRSNILGFIFKCSHTGCHSHKIRHPRKGGNPGGAENRKTQTGLGITQFVLLQFLME